MRPRPHPARETARQMRRQGLSLLLIARACRVSKPTVSRWCRDLPEHRTAAEHNGHASRLAGRVYPAGTRLLVNKLSRNGVPRTERLRLAREAAAEGRVDANQTGGSVQ